CTGITTARGDFDYW
nr:immunoglobulin heavy chain junction region [Mus musculus]MBK4195025.1 immunoglobulin heavy chain junction region [Mus musculus]